MAVAIPQVVTEVSASGAQIIDKTTLFEAIDEESVNTNGYLTRTFTSPGNRRIFTWSGWVRRTALSGTNKHGLFGCDGGSDGTSCTFCFDNSTVDTLRCENDFSAADMAGKTNAVLRDTSGFYHIVIAVDATQSSVTDGLRFYVNGQLQTLQSTSWTQNTEFEINAAIAHFIGSDTGDANRSFSGSMSQVYFIDGQSLDASHFGFTDDLTAQWRPKKYIPPSFTDLNNGRDWSSAVSGVSGWSQALAQGFNGSTSDAAEGNTNGETATIALGQDVTIAAGGVGVFTWVTAAKPLVFELILDGVVKETVTQGSSGGQWYVSSSYSGDIDSISIARTSDAPEWGAISINGQILIDSYSDPKGWGVNGCYLPLDGSKRIGIDQSGKGNDWTPVSMRDTTSLNEATGALPILNTVRGGKVATTIPGTARGQTGVGVTVYDDGGGDKYYIDGEKQATPAFYRGQSVTFRTDSSTVSGHPFRLSGVSNGAHSDNYYSVDFDGTGDYLSVAESTDWLFEEGDFTVEFWAYIDNIATDGGIVTNMDNFNSSSQYNSRWVIGLYSSELRVWTADDGDHVLHDYHPPQQEWVHYAFCRETGNSFSLYKNGIKIHTATQTCDLDTNGDLQIGYLNNLGTYDGKISDLRLVKGTAVYTENFTPPVSPLTNITNTVLICCNSSTVTGSTVTPTTITANGDPASSSDNPYDTYPFGTITGISEGTVGAATTITFPSNAPDTLYYYCTAHSGMGGSLTLTTDVTKADTHAWKNILALPLLGNKTDISNLVNCTTTAIEITLDGPVQDNTLNFNWNNFYGRCYYWDGSDDKITAANNSIFDLRMNGWTAECWARPQDDSDQVDLITYMTSTDGWYMFIDNNLKFGCGWQVSGGSYQEILSPANSVNWNQWQHFAAVCDAGTVKLYLNGILQSDTEVTTNDSQDPGGGTLGIGWKGGSYPDWLKGNIQDVRLYHICKYTENFTPASPDSIILPETPSGTAYGSALSKVTSGSVVFDGTDDRLIADIGSGGLESNFCIEYFIFADNVSSDKGHFQISEQTGGLDTATTSVMVSWGQSEADTNMYVGDANITDTTDPNQTNIWKHYAVVRNSGVLKLYVNGKEAYTGSNTVDMTTYRYVSISGYYSTSYLWKGFISNFRVVSGSPVYTAEFTPPTTPLTEITNTKLLCCQSSTSAGAAVASANLGGVNNGTVWSDGVTLPTTSITGAATNLFDGDITTFVQTTNTSEWVEVVLGSVSFSTSFELYGSSSYDQDYEFDHAGGTYSWTGNFGGNAWLDFASSLTSPVTAFRYKDSGGTGSASIAAVRVDSVILIDPVIPLGNSAGTNFNPFDTNTDIVEGRSTGYAIMNAAGKTRGEYWVREGGLVSGNSSSPSGSSGARGFVPATIGMKTGKWYAECTTYKASDGDQDFAVGIFPLECTGYYSTSGCYACRPNALLFSPSGVAEGYGATWYNGDVIGIAVDLESATKTITWYINNVATGTPVTIGEDRTFYYGYGSDGGGAGRRYYARWNFGQRPLTYAPPEGHKLLNYAEIENPTYVNPDRVVGIVTYTGNDESPRPVSGLNFDGAPNLVIVKKYTGSAGWGWYDTVRGSGALNSNGSATETNASAYGIMNSYEKNGFTVADGTDGGDPRDIVNVSGQSYIAYCWKAGGNKDTYNVDGEGYSTASAAGLTAGSNDPTGASVGTKQGFSIIKYTSTGANATVAHGLNAIPQFIIVKNTEGANNWHVYHESMGNTKFIYLDLKNSEDTSSTIWNDTSPTSTVFSLGSGNGVNNSSSNAYMAYCWHDVPGLQRFGSFIGNGGVNFVELDFKPRIVWIKRTVVNSSPDTSTDYSSWSFYDTTRNSYNGLTPNQLFLNLTNGQGYRGNGSSTSSLGDMTVYAMSNGFYISGPGTSVNANTGEYLYCAWAETPQNNLYGAQSNAR